MSDEKRDGLLDAILGRKDAAKELRETAEAITEELDEQGVAHKQQFSATELRDLFAELGDQLQQATRWVRATQAQAKARAISVDDLTDVIMYVAQKIEGVPDDQVREVINKLLGDALDDDTLEIDMGVFADDEYKTTSIVLAVCAPTFPT